MGDNFPNEFMNFLGHLLVSGNDPLVIVGNFMADAVKGRDLSGWSAGLQRGIRMHRMIDSYTDNHPLTLIGRERLRAHCGKYAGVALDLFYDHAIASNWKLLSPETLPVYAERMYALLGSHAQLMPDRTQHMLAYMSRHDWLSSYATVTGISRALAGLSMRVPGGEVLQGAEEVLVAHHEKFVEECMHFLPQLRAHLNDTDAHG
jgi:acyl carrier protein phosphodiesterase